MIWRIQLTWQKYSVPIVNSRVMFQWSIKITVFRQRECLKFNFPNWETSKLANTRLIYKISWLKFHVTQHRTSHDVCDHANQIYNETVKTQILFLHASFSCSSMGKILCFIKMTTTERCNTLLLDKIYY